MKQKLITLFFALAASVGTMFAEGTKIGNLYYNLNATDQTAEVTCELQYDENNYQGLTTANIPASVTYNGTTYSVTSIGDKAFENCSSLTSVTILNSVTSIGNSAFYNCSSLTSVTIPDSVTSIGYWAFGGCSGLTSVTIPNSVTNIGNHAFHDCTGLTSVTIPNSVTSIGYEAFAYCSSLTSVTIGNSVTSIEEGAFSGCSSLTTMTIPNSVTYIGGWVFEGCGITSPVYNSHVFAYMPPTYYGNYSIVDGIEVLSDGAFKNCTDMTSVTIPVSVTNIGRWTFENCSSLTSVTIPNSVTSIGEGAFSGCSGLTTVTIPNSVTYIGGWVFEGCGITSPVYNSHVFAYMPPTYYGSYSIVDGIELLSDGAFKNCTDMTSVTIPVSVTNIGRWTFETCSGLTSVTIPNSVTSIGEGAFSGCSGLTSVTLGTSVEVIEEYAFGACTAIETITCYSMRPPTANNGAFANLDYSTIVYVPADYLNTYKIHDFWGVYDVRPIGASKTETTEVKVEPTATTADVIWPAVENAATYELVIKDKNGNVVCTLIFNANGQLTQIAFGASARDNTAQAAGFAFTVTGLEEGTSYDLTITAKDANEQPIATYSGSFTTTSEGVPTGIDNTPFLSGEGRGEASKILRNGEVLILRDGKTYTIQGIVVK